MDDDHLFESFIQDGMTLPFEGWEFSVIRERFREAVPWWDYTEMARVRMEGVQRMLDMDTGGGEVLASLGGGVLSRECVYRHWSGGVLHADHFMAGGGFLGGEVP